MPRLLAVCAVAEPGGAELAALRVLRELAPRGWEPVVASPRDAAPLDAEQLEGAGLLGGAAAEWARLARAATAGARGVAEPPPSVRALAEAEGWRWEPLDAGGLEARAGARAVRAWPRARRLAAGADVVLVNGTVAARLLPALARLRVRRALWVHDVVDRVPPFWRLADVVMADSAAVAARIASLRPHVVFCPVDLDPPPADPPWTPDGRPVVGFVGRIEARKGPLDLVRAAPAIRAGAPGARVVIVGDDPYGSDPKYLAAVRSADGVEHYPWTANGPGLMRHLDVLVLPAHREPFGTVLSEAMAVGTPVVASAVDGLPEVVSDGRDGALVAPGDPAALAAAVLRVLADRDAMGAAAQVSARRFATPAVADRVEGLLRG